MKQGIALVLVAMAGCSSFSTDADYDPKTDFSRYHTWTWFTGPKPSGPSLDGLTEQRIRAALEEMLPQVGLTKTADAQADLLVTYHMSVQQRLEVVPTTTMYGYGWGHGYGGYYAGYGSEVRTYDEGTLLVDFIDAKTKGLAWRGVARGTVYRSSTPEEREERIRSAVQAILEQYPPSRH